MARIINSLLVLLACAVLGYAHNMQLRAHSRECFHEMLHADDRMTVTFQVGDREFGGSGNLDLDFWVRGNSWLCGWDESEDTRIEEEHGIRVSLQTDKIC